MQETVELTRDQGLATLRLSRQHGNAINGQLVADLSRAFERAGADPETRAVLLTASGKLFCPGLDLQELIELDRPAMVRFLECFERCILALYTFHKPVVAAIQGHAVAGGCILALTADWRVLSAGALIGLNEVRVGVPFPFGVAMLLREAVPPPRREEVALFGRNYREQEAVAAGLVHEVHPPQNLESYALQRLRELADKDPGAFAITKRYLRSPATERMRAAGPEHAAEFLDAWFSPPTQERLRGIVRELHSRS